MSQDDNVAHTGRKFEKIAAHHTRHEVLNEVRDQTERAIEDIREATGLSRTDAVALSLVTMAKYVKRATAPNSVVIVVNGTVDAFDDPVEALLSQLQLGDYSNPEFGG